MKKRNILSLLMAVSPVISYASTPEVVTYTLSGEHGVTLHMEFEKGVIRTSFVLQNGETLNTRDYFDDHQRLLVIGDKLFIEQKFEHGRVVAMSINGRKVHLHGANQESSASLELDAFQQSLSPEMLNTLKAYSDPSVMQTFSAPSFKALPCIGGLIGYAGEWVGIASCAETAGLGCVLALASHPFTVYGIATNCS